jgi:amino acid adenylation domain-containing protein/thioester reductase-like protein
MFSDHQGGSIHQLFEAQAIATPDAVAVVFQDQQLTYRELNQKANQLANHLQALGVKPEVLVGICVERSLEMIVGLLGTLKAGGAYVPLDPTYPSDRLGFILEDAQLSILISQQSLKESLPPHQAQTVNIEDWHILSLQSTENVVSNVQPDNLAYVIYTSGSTGKPKGVAIEHRNTTAFISWAKAFFTPKQLEGVLASTSLCFDLSIFEIFVTLSCGGKVILAQNALQLPELSAASQVTLINTVPSAIAALLRMKAIPPSVNTVNLAGEPLQNIIVQKLYELDHIHQVFNLYGPSEDTTYTTVALIEKGYVDIPPIGVPLPGTNIYLIEEPARRQGDELKLSPPGTPGEIYISGDGIARGYLNRPELTAESFIPNPFSSNPESRLYKTGDLAVYLADGNLKCLGRIDHQVKIRGFRVELGDIDAALNQHAEVSEGTVIAKEDASGNKRLVAYFVPKSQNDVSQSDPQLVLEQQINQWRSIWSATYHQSSQDSTPFFNIKGWNDSFTGKPIPAEQMHAWVSSTVDRILSLRPQRVLEIGCGMGLLLFRVAPHCSHYYGMDISAEAIETIEQFIQGQPDWSHVQVSQGGADEIDRFQPQSFDTIVINSVIQYFPSIDYLIHVLKKATHLIKPGGQIFIGDVRNLHLLKTFHTGVQLNHAPASLPCVQLQRRIQERMEQEQELVIDPNFFSALTQLIPSISHAQILLERGYSEDELTRFRSDVILHIETEIFHLPTPQYFYWQNQPSITALRQVLLAEPETLVVTGVPNIRVNSSAHAMELLSCEDCPDTVGTLVGTLKEALHLASGVHPETFWEIGQDLPYQVDITWSKAGHPGSYDVTFQRQNLNSKKLPKVLNVIPELQQELKPWSTYATDPLRGRATNNLVPRLRVFLKNKLPDYMVPSAFVRIESLPLTPNGKIDRRALPEPKKDRPELSEAYVAPVSTLECRLAEIWTQVLDIDQVGIHDNFFELGGNSLLTTHLLVQIEDMLKIELPLLNLLREPTIAGLIKSINQIQGTETTPLEAITDINLEADVNLDPKIYPEQPFNEVVAEPEHIFLTGATGFLGAFLLHDLLQQTQAKIYCLVRCSTAEEGRQKIQATLERYELWYGKLNSRVVPVPGDLSQSNLGLTNSMFHELGFKLDQIYHCGAFVNLLYPYQALRAANVLGTQSILKLASQGRATPVHYISTVDIFQSPAYFSMKVIQEDVHIEGCQNLEKGYAQSKWVAEKVIAIAQSRGIPVSIYRPGMLTGHSLTGVSQMNDLMCRIIKGVIQLKSAPDLDQWVNLTPVDYASKAIIHLSRQQTSIGKTFHIVNPSTLHWRKFIDEIRSFGYPIQLLPHEDWQEVLLREVKSQENALAPIAPLFTKQSGEQMTYLEVFLATSQSLDYQNTLGGLLSTSVRCPPLDSRLLNTYFSYFFKSGFIKLPGLEQSFQSKKYSQNLEEKSLPLKDLKPELS